MLQTRRYCPYMDTKRTLTTVLLALVVAALVAAPAPAAAPSAAKAQAIASAVWGPAPCGPVRVAYDAWAVGVIGFTRPDYANLAASECVIHLSPDLAGRIHRDDALLRCHTIVHEWGHLAGRRHSRRSSDVMFARPHRYYWRCRAAAR